MKGNRIVRSVCAAVLSLLFAFSAAVPSVFAAGERDGEIIWLPSGCSEPEYYNSELDWVICEDGDIYEASTGKRVYGYEMALTLADNLIFVKANYGDGLGGFIDRSGRIVIPMELTDVYTFTEGLACVCREVSSYDWRYGFIDEDGNTVIPFEYEDAFPFTEGLASVKKKSSDDGRRSCFIDKTGKVVLSLPSSWTVFSFWDGMAIVKEWREKDIPDGEKKPYYGYVDKTGTLVVPVEYDAAISFNGGLGWLEKDGKWGAVDHSGQFAVPLIYDDAELFADDLVLVKKDKKYGLYGNGGKLVVPVEYDRIYPSMEGMIYVELAGKMGFLDTNGNAAVPLEYEPTGTYHVKFCEGLADVGKDGKEGFVNKSGEVVIPLEYSSVRSFSEGLAFVGIGGKFGAIDKSGNLVIPMEYDKAGSFSGGVAYVKKDKKYGFIDKTGKVVISIAYNNAGFLKEEKYDEKGNELEIPAVFAWVKRGERYGVFRIPSDVSDGDASTLSENRCGENVTWDLDETTGVLTIRGQGAMYDYETGYDYWGAFSCNTPWWDYRHDIQEIVVASGVTHIGSNAFHSDIAWIEDGYDALRSVTLADSVISIGTSAFECDSSISYLQLGAGLENIGDWAFWGCEGIKEISLPEGLLSVGEFAFTWTDMKEVTIPRSVTYIGDGAFGYNSSVGGGPTILNGFTIYGYSGSAAESFYNQLLEKYEAEKAWIASDEFFSSYYSDNYPPDGTVCFVCLNAEDFPYAIFSNGDQGVDRYFKFGEMETFEDLVLSTPSTEYNPRLAHMLSIVARAAYNSDLTRDNFAELGFAVENQSPDFTDALDEIIPTPYAIAKKTRSDGSEIVLIAIRGSWGNLWEQSWVNNADIGSAALNGSGNHEGFERNAEDIYTALDKLMGGVENANATYVITGHSQAAATANLLAVKLHQCGIPASKVYDYNFSCPNVACLPDPNEWNPDGAYNNIFNIGNVEDPVTFLPSNCVKVYIPMMNPLSTWGKYGRSVWYSPDREHQSAAGHDMIYYVDEMEKELPITAYMTYAQIPAGHILRILGIHCPVDITVYDANGTPVAGVVDNVPYYSDSDCNRIVLIIDGDEKWICLPADQEYDIRIVATDQGEMLFEIYDYNVAKAEVAAEKVFEAVALTPGKEFSSVLSSGLDISDVSLFVMDQQGKIDYDVPSGRNGESPRQEGTSAPASRETAEAERGPGDERNTGSNHAIVFILLGIVAAAVVIAVVILLQKKKKTNS